MSKPEIITVGGRAYRKFIPFPRPIRDGTLRCIVCGQIDEPELHEDALCASTSKGAIANG